MNSLLPEGARSTLPPRPCPTVSSSHAALAVTTLWDVYSPPSDLICYLSVEHGDELAMNPSLRLASITHFSPSAAPIHPSSWNKNSRKFAPRNSHLAHKDSPFGLCALARPDSTIQLIVKPGALRDSPSPERPGFSVASSGGSGLS